ncbi:AAA family ATPase [Mycobacterium neumannii]
MLPLHKYYSELGPRTLSSIQVWFDELNPSEEEVFAPILRNDGRIWVSIRCSRGGGLSYRASRDATAEDSRQFYHEVLERFHFVKIPSVRVGADGDQGESQSLERLLDTLEAILIRSGSARSTNLQKEFAGKIKPVADLVRTVMNESAQSIAADLPFRENSVEFRLPDSRFALRGLLESAVIHSTGDVSVSVAERGTGFQSALVLGILRYVASRESQAGANVTFAIEEPEAFLHPQTQRAMAKIIGDISASAQTFVTTHSSVLVDSFNIGQVARIPLQHGGTNHEWKRPRLEPTDAGRLSRYCSGSNSELVFANAVILVEGEGDFAVVEKLLTRACGFPGGHYALGVTVIEAQGLGKMKYLVQLAEHFGVRSYVLSDRDGLSTRDGHRVLPDVLSERRTRPTSGDVDELRKLADQHVSSLPRAVAQQRRLNRILAKYDAFVLSSDLEGLLLDSFGVDELVERLGPSGQKVIDSQFAVALQEDEGAYEKLAAWMGSKGWNSDRPRTGKLAPHIPGVLVQEWFEEHAAPPYPMRQLVDWVERIVKQESRQPL